MARTNAVNFSGGLQFPMANAATDLFKKEDVQTLALAVDGHDHSSGKGLILPASAIPDGSITSAKIADGTIATADIAANAVQQFLGNYTANPTFSTTTTSSWLATPVTFSFTSGGGVIRVECLTNIGHSASGGRAYLGLAFDGGGTTPTAFFTASSAGAYLGFCLVQYSLSMGAGAHTCTLNVYNIDAGTLSLKSDTASLLYVTEQKR
jgi:hypothetical protein